MGPTTPTAPRAIDPAWNGAETIEASQSPVCGCSAPLVNGLATPMCGLVGEVRDAADQHVVRPRTHLHVAEHVRRRREDLALGPTGRRGRLQDLRARLGYRLVLHAIGERALEGGEPLGIELGGAVDHRLVHTATLPDDQQHQPVPELDQLGPSDQLARTGRWNGEACVLRDPR